MPWTYERPPVSMRHLPPEVLRKAVEMANAMLREGMEEGRAIRIATARAQAWARRPRHPPGADDGR